MNRDLIIGYGNPDRQDDGVAWHVLNRVNSRLGRTAPTSMEEEFESGGESPHLMFLLQLIPDLAETLADYQRVCFVDAHTGRVPDDIHVEEVATQYQTSPFTHHLTPASCLAIAQTLYGRAPQSILISIRGHQFGFDRTLSPETEALADEAARIILKWVYNQ